MNKAQKQALFEKAVNGLLSQNGPCVDKNRHCKLFHGRKRCAVGWTIPLTWKDRILRGKDTGGLKLNESGYDELHQALPDLMGELQCKTDKDHDFMGQLQICLHDRYAVHRFTDDWKQWVRTQAMLFAYNLKLNTKFLK